MTPPTPRVPAIRVELEDEWEGVVDPQRRRRLQNRLNQRAHRRRLKAAITSAGQPSKSSSPSLSGSSPTEQPRAPSHCASKEHGSDDHALVYQSPQPLPEPSRQIEFAELDQFNVIGPTADNCKRVLKQLVAFYRAEFAAGSLRTELLLGLTRLNFLRALHANMDVFGYAAVELHDDALSPFGAPGAAKITFTPIESLPLALKPTAIQLTTPHHPWLDLIPFPTLRDNLILTGEALDEAQLCHDMSGRGLPAGPESRRGAARGETGVVVWRDPWDPSGWEVTETFLRNWGWMLRGCVDVFRATNRWRRIRGEPALFRVEEV